MVYIYVNFAVTVSLIITYSIQSYQKFYSDNLVNIDCCKKKKHFVRILSSLMISNQIFEALTILKYMLPCNFIKRNVNKSLLFHFEPFANRQLSKENLNFYGSSSSTVYC